MGEQVDARTFWLVWPRAERIDEEHARDRWDTASGAENEAKRRARLHPGRAFYVAEAKTFHVSGDATGRLFEESIPF